MTAFLSTLLILIISLLTIGFVSAIFNPHGEISEEEMEIRRINQQRFH